MLLVFLFSSCMCLSYYFCFCVRFAVFLFFFFFSSRRRHTRLVSDWSSYVCSSDLSKWIIRSASFGPNSAGTGRVRTERRAPDDPFRVRQGRHPSRRRQHPRSQRALASRQPRPDRKSVV